MLANRFKKLCKRLGYKLTPLSATINFRLQRRPDLQSVVYHGDYILVVPRIMLPFPNRYHRDLLGIQLPDYFTCEKILYEKTFSQKNNYGKAL